MSTALGFIYSLLNRLPKGSAASFELSGDSLVLHVTIPGKGESGSYTRMFTGVEVVSMRYGAESALMESVSRDISNRYSL